MYLSGKTRQGVASGRQTKEGQCGAPFRHFSEHDSNGWGNYLLPTSHARKDIDGIETLRRTHERDIVLARKF